MQFMVALSFDAHAKMQTKFNTPNTTARYKSKSDMNINAKLIPNSSSLTRFITEPQLIFKSLLSVKSSNETLLVSVLKNGKLNMYEATGKTSTTSGTNVKINLIILNLLPKSELLKLPVKIRNLDQAASAFLASASSIFSQS